MIKKIANIILFLLTSKGEIAQYAVNNNIVSFEGQGRDKYGN